MCNISKLLNVSLIWAVTATMGFGLLISVLFHRQAIRVEEAQSTYLLHSTVAEIIRPSLRISDYAEVRRILERISAPAFIFGVIVLPNDIILGDYQFSARFKDTLSLLEQTKCLTSNKLVIRYESHKEILACSHLSLGKVSEPPVVHTPGEQNLHAQGFSNITLTTGYEKESFKKNFPNLAVIGKEPPF